MFQGGNRVFIVTDQRKPHMKTLFKHIGGITREAVTAMWVELCPRGQMLPNDALSLGGYGSYLSVSTLQGKLVFGVT